MRSPSDWITWEKASASSFFAIFMAERLLRITVRGERSSWEAEAMNCICRFRLSRRGRMIRPVKNQEKTESRRMAARSIEKNNIR